MITVKQLAKVAGAVCVTLGVLLTGATAWAETPHDVVRGVTTKLMAEVEENRQFLETEPDKFYSAVGDVLEPVVDFKFIAMSVMGPYSKKAAPEQKDQFVEVFKGGLINTYAKGMAGFGDLDIVVLPPEGDITGQRRVSVVQEVRGDDGGVNRISYTMGKNRQGEWKLINVVLNGINLGKTFRSQFMQAMKKQGDLNQVITEWAAEDDTVAAN
ncbi:ABC transporter substrate-binding protein [Maricurvus nonylphenolicus]|uniref:MlaC/ttg2D family ABC transporter substrate-binding protein n=1 Tax=Maricurvus nonylphenolicus TaxID=1008307 RepID=UPI0036F37DFF